MTNTLPDALPSDPTTKHPRGWSGLPHFLHVRLVAFILGRSTRTIRNWVRCGLAHPTRIGRSMFFTKEEVDRLIAADRERRAAGSDRREGERKD